MTKIIHQVGDVNCPYCKVPNTVLAGECAPTDGDISICAYCILPAIIVIDSKNVLSTRKPITPEEWSECLKGIDDVTKPTSL